LTASLEKGETKRGKKGKIDRLKKGEESALGLFRLFLNDRVRIAEGGGSRAQFICLGVTEGAREEEWEGRGRGRESKKRALCYVAGFSGRVSGADWGEGESRNLRKSEGDRLGGKEPFLRHSGSFKTARTPWDRLLQGGQARTKGRKGGGEISGRE